MKLNQRFKTFSITLLLFALSNCYGQDDDGSVKENCKFTEFQIDRMSSAVSIFEQDRMNRKWSYYQKITFWWGNRENELKLKALEERWHNLGCVHYDIEQRRKNRH